MFPSYFVGGTCYANTRQEAWKDISCIHHHVVLDKCGTPMIMLWCVKHKHFIFWVSIRCIHHILLLRPSMCLIGLNIRFLFSSLKHYWKILHLLRNSKHLTLENRPQMHNEDIPNHMSTSFICTYTHAKC